MTISIDWPSKIISVFKVDMTLIQTVPTTIYELDINTFRLVLKDLEDDEEGIVYDTTHVHVAPITVGGVQLARVIQIINNYTITFEDDQYAVNLIGANSNIADRVNVNQVSVRSANSAGLVQTSEIEYASFNGGVTINVIDGFAGQAYPIGTAEKPVNNLDDAIFIANLRGFDHLFIRGDLTFVSGDVIDNFVIVGQSVTKTDLVINDLAIVTNCEFRNSTISGTLDGGSSINKCNIGTLSYVDGNVVSCVLELGTITLNGTEASFIDCVSGVPGILTPIIDFNGTGTAILIRHYSGGIKFINHTSGNDSVSIDLDSGHIILDSTITSGDFTVRGVGKLTNNSTGTATVHEEMLDSHNLNRSSFSDGSVYFNSSSSESGTVFPLGTPARPINNLSDALSIADENGLNRINFVGSATATASHNLDGIIVIGGSGILNILTLNGCSTSNSGFEKLIIVGDIDGVVRISDCFLGKTGVGGITGAEGTIVDSVINHIDGVIQNATGVGTLFDNCAFITPDDQRIDIDLNGVSFSLRDCTGRILIKNKTDILQDQLNMKSGCVKFDSTCTAGSISLSGSMKIIDNSVGTTINSSGKISSLIWDHKTDDLKDDSIGKWVYGKLLSFIKFISLK